MSKSTSKARVQRWRQRFQVGMHRRGSRRPKVAATIGEGWLLTDRAHRRSDKAWLGVAYRWFAWPTRRMGGCLVQCVGRRLDEDRKSVV